MNHRHSKIALAGSVLLAFGAIAPAMAPAQTSQPAQPPPQRQQAPAMNPKDAGPPPSDAEVHHFVNAALQVQVIKQQATQQFDAAKTEADRTRIRDDAEAKMEATIKQNQLTVARYNQIFTAMQTNDKVQQKVQKAASEQQSGAASSG